MKMSAMLVSAATLTLLTIVPGWAQQTTAEDCSKSLPGNQDVQGWRPARDKRFACQRHL